VLARLAVPRGSDRDGHLGEEGRDAHREVAGDKHSMCGNLIGAPAAEQNLTCFPSCSQLRMEELKSSTRASSPLTPAGRFSTLRSRLDLAT